MNRLFAIFCILSGLVSCRDSGEINLGTLLQEMVDREQITYFPVSGYQCLQASSYNRESVSPDKPGWFADSDGVGFIRTELIDGKKEWVIMEDEGPGVITKIWAVCFYYGLKDTIGANIKFYLDGSDEPVINTNFFSLVKGQDFVKPPFAEESTRAGNLYLPIPYAKSCKITMDKKSFYNIINYRKYPEGTLIKTFTMEDFRKAKDLREEVGQILENPPKITGQDLQEEELLRKGESVTLNLPEGANTIKLLEIKVNRSDNYPQALRSTVMIGNFDGRNTVWCPVGDFFNNVGRVQPYSMWERTVEKDSTMVSRWWMPYQKSGAISINNFSEEPVDIQVRVVVDKYDWNKESMHFYASWHMDMPTPTFPLFDWNFLSAEGKGVVVGDQWAVLNPAEGWWGEGDEKIFVDEDFDRNFPSHFGTGTEDYYGWAGGVVPTPDDQFSKPFLGNIIVGHPRSKGYNVCTRTRVLDAIPFRKKIKFDMESSCGTRQRWFYLQYAQTTFWYGTPGVSFNRKPLPSMAAKKLPLVEDLERKMEEARSNIYIAIGAFEAELMKVSPKSKTVTENFADIPVWGELSNGALKNLWFQEEGDFVEIKITEQFQKSVLEIAIALGRNCGIYDIYVNDEFKSTQDLYSNHAGITNPYINLGENDPVDNAFRIKFVYRGINAEAEMKNEKAALGIDFFLIENIFLNR